MSLRQRSTHDAVLAGLGFTSADVGIERSKIFQNYKAGLLGLDEALKNTPNFLENYILNEIFKDLFLSGSSSPLEYYLQLIIRFALIRFMLAAQCADINKLPKIDVLVQTVQVFCRRYQHDRLFAENVNNCFRNAGWIDINKIFRFIKV
jgi:lysine-N-methylase